MKQYKLVIDLEVEVEVSGELHNSILEEIYVKLTSTGKDITPLLSQDDIENLRDELLDKINDGIRDSIDAAAERRADYARENVS